MQMQAGPGSLEGCVKWAELGPGGMGEGRVTPSIKRGGRVLPTCRGLAMRGGALWGQISIFFKGEVGHQVVTGKPLIFPCWLQVQHRKTTEQAGEGPLCYGSSPADGCYLFS